MRKAPRELKTGGKAAQRAERARRGLCNRCGRKANPKRGKGVWCDVCLDRAADRMRGRRQDAGEEGKCLRCLARPPVEDNRYCQECLVEQPKAVARFQAAVPRGFCRVCRKQPEAEGYSGRCGGCVLKHRSRGRTYYHRRRRSESPEE